MCVVEVLSFANLSENESHNLAVQQRKPEPKGLCQEQCLITELGCQQGDRRHGQRQRSLKSCGEDGKQISKTRFWLKQLVLYNEVFRVWTA